MTFRQRIRRYLWILKFRLESLLELTFCKYLVVWRPFPTWSNRCGKFQCETLKEDVRISLSRIRVIRHSLKWVAKRVPWKSKCLDQAMAAQRMLARRKLSSTLYLGMIKNKKNSWDAHAWVRCGDQWVIGEKPDVNYTVVGTYALTV